MLFIANLNGFVQPFGMVAKTTAAPLERSCSAVAWSLPVKARANPSFTDSHEAMVNDAASKKMIFFINCLLVIRAVLASSKKQLPQYVVAE